jgi:toxin ParE1/3/4
MRDIRLTPLARHDLEDIWTYTLAEWGLDQSEAYLLALDHAMKTLAQTPGIGRSIDEIRKGYLLFPSGSHLLIYRLKPQSIEFVRILHKRMDVTRHL